MDDAIRVLCVDDDEALLDTTAAFIERDGLVALTETSAHAAIARLDETKIDCVVSDYQMPGMDGLELLARVRESTPAMPFILFTGKGSEGIASEAISAGVTDYLQKGRTTGQYEVLINRIENAVAKRRTERDLQRTQSRYRRLAEQNLVGIYIVRDGRIQYANPKLAEIFGYDRDELVGLSPLSLVASDCDLAAEVLASHERGEQSEAHYTFTGRRKDGTTVEVEVHGGRVEYEGETAVIGVCKDIDHRRRREYTLRALHDATGDLMCAHTKEAVAERAVAAAEDVLGFSVAVVRLYDPETDRLAPVATTDATTTLLGERPAFGPSEALPWRAFASAEPIVAGGDIETYGANDVPFESTLYVPLDGHGTLSIGSEDGEFTDSDIRLAQVLAANTAAAFDRVERESALERYETIVETVEDAVYTVDSTGDFDFVNEAFATLSGYTRNELLGSNVSLLKDSETVERFEDTVRRLLRGEFDQTTVSLPLRTADGEVIPCEDHLTLLPYDEEYQGCAGVIRDLTEYKERERELERQNERLAEFASVVSHDLRNPLGVARGRLELAHEDTPSEHHEDVRWALSRMDSLTEDLLALARQGEVVDETTVVSLESIARAAWVSIEHESADLTLSDLNDIEADPDRLQRLLENLFRNAVEHTPQGVSVCVGHSPKGFFVADDGPGIAEGDRERVFESGHSTGEGTGLGLAIVRTIAEAHGWTVSISRSDAGGARFDIRT